MAIKTFTAGSVLTASDTNTYLANSGLVYVTSATVGSGVSSVNVSSCFSSTYDNYKIVLSGGVGSTAQAIQLQLTGSSASYYGILTYVSYATGATTNVTTNNGSLWQYVGESSSAMQWIDIDIFNPNLAKYTMFGGQYVGSVAGTVGGYHAVASSYTGFTLSVAGTMTGGTITVYGYRKA